MKRLHAGLPRHVILVLDAAYAEYVRRNDYEAGFELVATSENVVMMRTFSKIHGLAALRLGWAYCPRRHRRRAEPRARAVQRLLAGDRRGRRLAQGRRRIPTARIAHNERWLPWLSDELRALGLQVLPSVGNFILVRFPGAPGPTAPEADAALQADGIFVRRMDAYGLSDSLRITIGTEEANRLVVESLARLMDKSRA